MRSSSTRTGVRSVARELSNDTLKSSGAGSMHRVVRTSGARSPLGLLSPLDLESPAAYRRALDFYRTPMRIPFALLALVSLPLVTACSQPDPAEVRGEFLRAHPDTRVESAGPGEGDDATVY